MITRLHSKYPELAAVILSASHDKMRLAAVTAARLAIPNAGLRAELREAALTAIELGKQDAQLRARLEEEQGRADDRYLDVQDALKAGEALPADALHDFRKARAIAAVLGALGEADGPAVADLVYEAIASSPVEGEIVSEITRVAT